MSKSEMAGFILKTGSMAVRNPVFFLLAGAHWISSLTPSFFWGCG
jgi:hypothetical protein